ncbi:MAG: dNTP triphosphohydrolase [Bryobacterales bacterium]|nr:dNTP triphosphohydrolase [Bryobacterales bacterium]
MLDFLRFPVHASRGRRYPEPAHPYRNDFQRDRDRVIHTRAFRRLEAKTQVFAPSLCDHFRNRLTHTIEVAQISRTVAGALGLNEDLTEALALAHDIGHPPFAHAGEEELDRQMLRFGEHFDHNLHALRIVESFEQRYIRFPGLNLTFEVREGIVKHSRDLPAEGDAELAEYLPDQRPPLEAQLIDLADEAAYNTADLDDAWSAGLLIAPDIAAAVPAFAEILDTIESQYPGATGREQFQEALRALVDTLVSGLIDGTREAARQSGVDSVEEVRAYPRRLAAMSPDAAQANAQVKALLHAYVYNSPELLAERERSRERVAGLFALLLAEPRHMPAPYQEAARERPAHRVVCEYIAGMTDGFFRRTYDTLFTPRN